MTEKVADLRDEGDFLKFVAEELQFRETELTLLSEFRKIPVWSSLNALLFISRVNEETGILISSADLAACLTLGDIHNLVKIRYHGLGHH